MVCNPINTCNLKSETAATKTEVFFKEYSYIAQEGEV